MSLPLPAGYLTGVAYEINDSGVIIGEATNPSIPGLPFHVELIWVNGVAYKFKDLLQPPGGLGYLWGINNAGTIIATAPTGTVRLWNPINPPAGDMNGDCRIDGLDLGLMLESWGDSAGIADLDGDGVVGGADLGILLGGWTSP